MAVSLCGGALFPAASSCLTTSSGRRVVRGRGAAAAAAANVDVNKNKKNNTGGDGSLIGSSRGAFFQLQRHPLALVGGLSASASVTESRSRSRCLFLVAAAYGERRYGSGRAGGGRGRGGDYDGAGRGGAGFRYEDEYEAIEDDDRRRFSLGAQDDGPGSQFRDHDETPFSERGARGRGSRCAVHVHTRTQTRTHNSDNLSSLPLY